MAYCVSTTMWQIIILTSLICSLQVSTEMHTLFQYCTTTTGIKGLPAYIQIETLDDKVLSHYDSTTQRKVPAQCMKSHLDPQFWNWSIEDTKGRQKLLTEDLTKIMNLKNQTAGEHVLQLVHYCEWDDETRARGYNYEMSGYDGENSSLITVRNTIGLTQELKESLDDCGSNTKSNCLEYCFRYVKSYSKYRKECLEKVTPEVSLFQNSSSVVCHATGFYPKAVNITWKRDGEEILEDVYVAETLPNGDGTFQKRAVLRVSPEERCKGTYTCEVEHKTGLIIKTLMVGNCKRGNSNATVIEIVIGIVIAIVIVIAIAVAIVVRRVIFFPRRQDQEASSRSLELLNRNDRDSTGSDQPLTAQANNVPTYS